jgi:hypothetical protein
LGVQPRQKLGALKMVEETPREQSQADTPAEADPDPEQSTVGGDAARTELPDTSGAEAANDA